MSNMENKTFRAIDKILWTDWDPIGINDLQMCRDEYRSYVPEIYRMKVAGGNKEAIARKLLEISEREMGIKVTMEFCSQVAGRIVAISKQ